MLSFKPDYFSKSASKENPLSALEMRIVAELHMVKDELLKELSLIVSREGCVSHSFSLPEGLKRKPGGSRISSHSSIDTTFTTWSPAHPNEVMEGSYTSLLRQERADAQNVSHDPQTVGRYVVGFRHRWMNSTSGFSNIIQGRTFDALASVAVVANAIAIGMEVHMKCAYGLDVPERLAMMEFYGDLFFLAIFSVEWLLRVMAAGLSFFSCTSDTCHWNWLDTLSLLSQVVDQVYNFVENSRVYFSSTMRLVRVMRIFRIVRLLHLSEKLGMLAHAIARSLVAVSWALMLMLVFVYAFSVTFTDRVWTVRGGDLEGGLDYYFKDVPRTTLTLTEAVLGGLSWDEVVSLLFSEVGWLSGVMFVVFVFLGFFILCNVVTGILTDGVAKSADEEGIRQLALGLQAALGMEDLSDDDPQHVYTLVDQVSWNEFRDKVLYDVNMREYFLSINVEPTEASARKLFEILDQDHNETLTKGEVFYGCMKLREPARSFDLTILMHQLAVLHKGMEYLISNSNRMNEKVATPKSKHP